VVTPQAELQDEYHKTRLVPFGEYVPFGHLAALFGHDFPEFSAGRGPAHIDIDGIGRIQPLICYEGIFPQFVGRGEVRPDLLILITNDGWFGAGQGPAQHFAQARARAIELGLPMLRVANRGVTALIDPWGRSRERLDLHERGALDAPIPKPRAATFYAKNPWIGVLILVGLLALGAFIRAQVNLSLTPLGGTFRKP
jgi:apolipoprotein N-acyltransferase